MRLINITENLKLKEISSLNSESLFELMQEIYPKAYSHFWEDLGESYILSQYSKENIVKELLEKKAEYYFVLFKNEIIGNLRIIWDKELSNSLEGKIVKLHRVYLHPKIQGNGIGKKLLFWLEEKAIKKGYKFIWLDVMNEQQQAFEFYKKRGYKYYSHSFLNFDLMYLEYRKMSQVYKKLI